MRNFSALIEHAKILKKVHQTGRSFHVAFAINGGKVVEVGVNSYSKTNCVSGSYKPRYYDKGNYIAGIHAEMKVTGKLKFYDVSKITLVVLRIDNNGNLAYSKPCSNCAYHLGLKNYKKVYYSTGEQTFEKL